MSGIANKEDIRKLFNRVDTSGDGSLSPKELESFLTTLGITQAQIAEYVVSLDKNNDSKLSFEEFYPLFCKRNVKDVPDSELKDLFNKYDKDGSGYIDVTEAKVLLSGVKNLDQEKILKEFERYDKNSDGRISFDEFVKHTKNSRT